MKQKIIVLSAFVIGAILAISLVLVKGQGSIVTSAQSQDAHGQHMTDSQIRPEQVRDRPGTISGEAEPNRIPDHVAFELFMRSLIPQGDDNELEQRRVSLYAQDAGFEEGETIFLLLAARDLNKQLEVLDKQAAEIKDRTWPNPAPSIIGQLSRLEAQRVAVVKKFMAELHLKLGAQPEAARGRSEKVLSYVNNSVKRKVKITPSDLPVKQ